MKTIRTFLTTTLLVGLTLGGGPACSSSVPDSASTGFDVKKDGFSFENYGGSSSYSAFGVTEMVRMFGAKAVCVDDRTPCNPKPGALAWARSVDQSMNAGRCEGFAVLSQMFFSGAAKVSDFGASTPFDLSIGANEKLGSELAYWFGSQMAGSVLAGKVRKFQAEDVMRFLAEILQPGAPEAYRLGILNKRGGRITGGHALTPIGYRKITGGVYELRVYDNNVPGEERILTIDTSANRWSYVASLNPSEEGSLYFGDADNRNPLYFAPVKARIGEFACKFCNKGSAQAVVNTSGNVTVKDNAGNVVTLANGEISSSGSGSFEPSFNFALATSTLLTAELPSDTITATVEGGDTTLTLAGATQSASFTLRQIPAAEVESAPGVFDPDAGMVVLPPTPPAAMTMDPSGATFSATSDTQGSVNLIKSITNADGTIRTISVTIEPPQGASITSSIDDQGQVRAEVKGGQDGQLIVQVAQKDGEQGTASTFTLPSGPSQSGATTIEATVPQDPAQPITAQSTDGTGKMKPLVEICNNGVKDATESDVDCGGTCGACVNGGACAQSTDCQSGFCGANVCQPLPTGGTITTAGGFRIHTFASNAEAFQTFGPLLVEYLIVAGGGGGGSGDGGGGGGGGVVLGTTNVAPGIASVDVGMGGVGGGLGPVGTPSDSGGNSSFLGIVVIGGGRGGQEGTNMFVPHPLNNGFPGGSGGGYGGANSPTPEPGAPGTPGEGFAGGTRPSNSFGMGGGGGAAGPGGDGDAAHKGGDGGPGRSFSISGTATFYGGGGGGSGRGARGNGGSGGGGDGAVGTNFSGLDGVDGTGGGGGGGEDQLSMGGRGGQGIIVVRYPL